MLRQQLYSKAKPCLRHREIPTNPAWVTAPAIPGHSCRMQNWNMHTGFQINRSSLAVFTVSKWSLQVVGESRFWFPFTAKRD